MRLLFTLLTLVVVVFCCKKETDTPDPTPIPVVTPKVCFLMSPTQEASLDSVVSFKNCSDSVGVTYLWDFGDVTTSTKKDPAHVFSKPGEFNVTLTILVKGVASASVSQKIKILIGERYIDILPMVTPRDFIEGADGSIYVIGTTKSTIETKLYLTKFDKYLRIKWTKFWKNEWSDRIRSIEYSTDGNLILGGNWDLDLGRGPINLIKTDTSGTVIWKRQYPVDNGFFLDFRQSADGGIIGIGQEDYPYNEAGNKIGYTSVIKLDKNGVLSWKKIYNKEGLFSSSNILPLTDGYEFAASSSSMNGCLNCYDSLVVVKTDLSGKIIWKKSNLKKSTSSVGPTYIAVTNERVFAVGPGSRSMLLDENGGVVKYVDINPDSGNWINTMSNNNFITGSGFTLWNKLFLTSYDKTGTLVWEKRFGRRNKRCFPELGYGIVAASLRDHSLLYLGTSYKDCPKEDETSMYLAKISENGDIL